MAVGESRAPSLHSARLFGSRRLEALIEALRAESTSAELDQPSSFVGQVVQTVGPVRSLLPIGPMTISSRIGFALLGIGVSGCGSANPATSPPTGGAVFELSADLFAATVEPVLVAEGCDAAGDCHGGGIRGTFELSPASAKDIAFDFEQARRQVNPYAPDASPILAKPLAEPIGGAPHSLEPFASVDDPGYAAIRAWIDAGEFR
jgi:hypothetical protein